MGREFCDGIGMTETRQKFVLLFRSPTEGTIDRYHQILEGNGFVPVSVPVLKFDYINKEEYDSKLNNYKGYHAIVFTSQQAVKVTEDVVNLWTEEKRDELVKNVLCYTVGKATAKAAKQLGFSPHGEDTGNAECLAEVIINERSESETRAVLFPCSSIRKDTISDRLQSKGVSVDELHVYETTHRDDICKEVNQLIVKYGDPYCAVFFSPSGVQAFKKNNLHDNKWRDCIKMIALGPSTQTEMEKEGIVVHGTCVKPEPESLLKLIKS